MSQLIKVLWTIHPTVVSEKDSLVSKRSELVILILLYICRCHPAQPEKTNQAFIQ